MGAKQSTERKESGIPATAPCRTHQYEEIDDTVLATNQEKYKEIHSSSLVCGSGLESPNALGMSQTLAAECKGKYKSLPDILAAPATESLTTSAESIQVSTRYHPYDEISDELSHNLSSAGNKAKKKELKEKKGKKKHKKETELITPTEVTNCKSVPDAAATGDVLSGSTQSATRYHPYDDVDEDLLHVSNTNKRDKEDKSKTKKDLKTDKKKQKKPLSVDTNMSLEVASKLSISTGNMTPATRGHTYEEISDAQILSNRANKKTEKQENTTKDKDKCGNKKHKALPKCNNRENETVVNSTSLVNSKSVIQLQTVRYHPYDEITTEDLESIRNTTKEHGDRLTEESEAHKADDKIQMTETEYLNVGAAQTLVMQSVEEDGCTMGQLGYSSEDNITDVYAVPQKKPAKTLVMQSVEADSCTKGQLGYSSEDNIRDVYAVQQKKPAKNKQVQQLNYIEVEFNPAAPRVEVKSQYSPTSYSNVVRKDGKILLVDS